MSEITVAIATRDRASLLLRTLERLAAMPESPPVVVVDNGSSDGTAEAVGSLHPDALVIALGRNAGSAARNVAVEAATTPWVAFCDDDSWWAPGSLRRAASIFRSRPALGLLAARVLVGPELTPDPIAELLATGPVLGFLACGALVRRSAHLEVGGFHPRLGIGGEEELLAIDLAARGWQLDYDPWVIAHHHPPSGGERAARRRRQVRNALCIAWLRRRPRSALMRTLRTMREVRDPEVRGGLRDVVDCLGWVLRERRPVDRELDAQLALVNRAQQLAKRHGHAIKL